MIEEPLDWARVPLPGLTDPRLRKRLRTWGAMQERQGRVVTSRKVDKEYMFEAWDDLQVRSIDSFVDHPGLTEQLMAIQGITPRPWRVAGLREALGVPAIFGAVTMISNLTGSMSMEAFRGEVQVSPEDRPRIIVSPDPFTIPREFYRMTAYNLATRGEAWWWIAMRDGDGNPISVLNINPAEIDITDNPDDLRYPIIKWRDKRMPNEDMRQLVYSREPGSLRGQGPLQICGAAISVAVESQEWAANFFADGGVPSIVIKAAGELSGDPINDPDGYSEMQRLANQWMDKPHNTPRFIDQGIESVTEVGKTEEGAQMLQARAYQNVDVATMFNMNATLLNAAVSGSSLTYQNVGSKFDEFVRMCLQPNYLEVIEQTMTDLCVRQIVARFNKDTLTLADIKTRYDVYAVGIASGIIDAAEARSFEGLAPGDVENAAVPFAPPAAIPSSLPIQMRSEPVEFRCSGQHVKRQGGISRLAPCNRLLSTTGSFVGMCPRCKKVYDAVQVRSEPIVAPVIPITVRQVKTTQVVSVEPPPAPADISNRELLEHLPAAIAAAIPHPEPQQPPTLHVHEGAIRSEVHMSSSRKRVERDGTGYVITEEPA
jgi:HK97 family phage portal protein